jgi:hypothetical protein
VRNPLRSRPGAAPNRSVAAVAALATIALAGIGTTAATLPGAAANIIDPSGHRTNEVGLALAWVQPVLGHYSPAAADFTVYDDQGNPWRTSTCETVHPGSQVLFLVDYPNNHMPTDKNMSFTLTLYAGPCQRTNALWDYSGVPTDQEKLEYQWITKDQWDAFSGGQQKQSIDISPGHPGHSWLAGYRCPAICPR